MQCIHSVEILPKLSGHLKGLLKQGPGSIRIAGRVEDPAAFQQVANARAGRDAPQPALHLVQRLVGVVELALEPLGPGDLGQQFEEGRDIFRDLE